jgi:hypothetical protein
LGTAATFLMYLGAQWDYRALAAVFVRVALHRATVSAVVWSIVPGLGLLDGYASRVLVGLMFS